MKKTQKIFSIVLAVVMALTLSLAAFAADTGSITITSNDKVSVAGRSFSVYKILDAKLANGTDAEDGVVYTVPTAMEDWFATYFSLNKTLSTFDVDVVNKINALSGSNLDAFAEAALAAAKAAGITPVTQTATLADTTVVFDGLPLGYYVVADSGSVEPISAVALDTTAPDAEIVIKADKPDLDKSIDGSHADETDESTTGLVDENNEAVGDKVPYVIESKVPAMDGFSTMYKYVVTDTMSKGLTYNEDMVITIGDKTLEKGVDYSETVTNNADGTTTIVITFANFLQYRDQKGEDITLTYSATINEDAVIGVEGNTNSANLEYSNNPNEESETETTPDSITYTYVTGLTIEKVDPQGNILTGAQFKIEGTKLNIVLVDDDTTTTDDPYRIVETKEAVEATGYVDENGNIVFNGLSAGTYTITELVAPEGYNLLDEPIEITIGWSAPEGDDVTDCTWTVSDGATVLEDGTIYLEVVNNAGGLLPSTGGIGTTIFYILGGLLLVGAVVILISKKRVATEA